MGRLLQSSSLLISYLLLLWGRSVHGLLRSAPTLSRAAWGERPTSGSPPGTPSSKKKKILKETSASAGLPLSKQVLYIVLCPVYEACLFLKPWSSSRSWWTTAHNTRGSDFHISEDAVFRCKATFEQAETQERLLRKLNMVWISGMEFVTEKEGIEYTRSRTPLGLANAATDVSGSQTLLNILPPLNDTLILHF